MDSHFHGNDIRSNEIATGSTQVILSAPLVMTEGLVPAFAGMTYGEVGMTEV